ncbi:hypothetical protein FHG87_015825 [Trinorchestia longiramus]|nr:hypothetical protein FHG87_015825 [Trinorchestia longiramus]
MGVGVTQTKNELLLEQTAYIKALLSRFSMDKANSVATPVDVNADLVTTSDEVEECDKDLYQSAVDPYEYQRLVCSQLLFAIRFQFLFQYGENQWNTRCIKMDSGKSYPVGSDEECNMIVVDAMKNFLVHALNQF